MIIVDDDVFIGGDVVDCCGFGEEWDWYFCECDDVVWCSYVYLNVLLVVGRKW